MNAPDPALSLRSDARQPLATAGSALPGPHLLDATLFWVPGGGSGGVHQVLAAKRRHLTANGWRHTLMAPGIDGPGGLDCGGLPIPGTGGYRFVLGRGHAARLIEQARPDIVEAGDPYTLGWSVLDAAARLDIPSVAFCHSNLPELAACIAGSGRPLTAALARRVGQLARRYLTHLYGRYDLVLSPSLSMTRQLQAWGLRQAQHQPLGVDCTTFDPQARDPHWRVRLEDQLELARGTRLLIYAGRFAPEKNLGLLAEAVRRLGPGHVLLAVGSGPCPPAGDAVRVLPPEPDRSRLARMLASCDAFVHAGEQETFGLAALEAMACGTPVVVSAHAGLGELAGGVGLTVASRRAQDWAQAISASLHQDVSALTAAALARAREHDWNRVLAQLARRYQQQILQHRLCGRRLDTTLLDTSPG